ncbi:hypothetical protein LCGC14_0742240 [marine sediment metagenome]|uniref:Uncharacterized protein n=1 Tax=marine sediment metagenome TaxID=412755 RepID=A0A0F9SRE4_9ZZZZ
MISEEFKISIGIILTVLYFVLLIVAAIQAQRNASLNDPDAGLKVFGIGTGLYVGLFAIIWFIMAIAGAGSWISTGTPPSKLASAGIVFYGVLSTIAYGLVRSNNVQLQVKT